jgi:hypothetical protein
MNLHASAHHLTLLMIWRVAVTMLFDIIKALEDMFGIVDGATGLIQETTVATILAFLLVTFE